MRAPLELAERTLKPLAITIRTMLDGWEYEFVLVLASYGEEGRATWGTSGDRSNGLALMKRWLRTATSEPSAMTHGAINRDELQTLRALGTFLRSAAPPGWGYALIIDLKRHEGLAPIYLSTGARQDIVKMLTELVESVEKGTSTV